MIPTFVITLREGVEASLIVGIIAAFLVKEGRKDALRQMWVGVGIAVVLCTAVGVGLDIGVRHSGHSPQRGDDLRVLGHGQRVLHSPVARARHSPIRCRREPRLAA